MLKDDTTWTLADETTFIGFLHEHKAAAGDGTSFKVTTFEATGAVLETKWTKGGPKTVKACSNKWNAVHDHCINPILCV